MLKRIIIIAIILVLIGLALLFLSQKKAVKELPVANQPVTNEVITPLTGPLPPLELTEEEKIALLKNELKIKARNFAERYGSFSTDARFANLYEFEDEMSRRFWQETENYILTKKEEEIKEFYGITTKVLNVEEISFSENEANYLILTQRQERKGIEEKVFYQEMELRMIKENDVWKVDQITWRQSN